jgi:hypothetical protein
MGSSRKLSGRHVALLLPVAAACSLLAPSDKELFGGDAAAGNAGFAGNAGSAGYGAEAGGGAGNTTYAGGTRSSGGSNPSGGVSAASGTSTNTSAQGGASVALGGTTGTATTSSVTVKGGTTAAGGSAPSAGGSPPAVGGVSPNGNCQYGSTGNNNDACAAALEDVWRCVASSAQNGAWVSQVCHSGKWVTFHISPRDCAGCCGGVSAACCQANHTCSLAN